MRRIQVLIGLVLVGLLAASCGGLSGRSRGLGFGEYEVRSLPSPPLLPRRGHMVADLDGTLLVFGGEQLAGREAVGSSGPLLDGAIFSHGDWAPLPDLPAPRTYDTTVAADGVLYVGGPADPHDNWLGQSTILSIASGDSVWHEIDFAPSTVGPLLRTSSGVYAIVRESVRSVDVWRLDDGQFTPTMKVVTEDSKSQFAASGDWIYVLDPTTLDLRRVAPSIGLSESVPVAPSIKDIKDVGALQYSVMQTSGNTVQVLLYSGAFGDKTPMAVSQVVDSRLVVTDTAFGHMIGGGIQYTALHDGSVVSMAGLVAGVQHYTVDGSIDVWPDDPIGANRQWITGAATEDSTRFIGWYTSHQGGDFLPVAFEVFGTPPGADEPTPV